jgi:hypothetical protein
VNCLKIHSQGWSSSLYARNRFSSSSDHASFLMVERLCLPSFTYLSLLLRHLGSLSLQPRSLLAIGSVLFGRVRALASTALLPRNSACTVRFVPTCLHPVCVAADPAARRLDNTWQLHLVTENPCCRSGFNVKSLMVSI